MKKVFIVEDDVFTYSTTTVFRTYAHSVKFTDAEASRIKAAEEEWSAVQALIRDRMGRFT